MDHEVKNKTDKEMNLDENALNEVAGGYGEYSSSALATAICFTCRKGRSCGHSRDELSAYMNANERITTSIHCPWYNE